MKQWIFIWVVVAVVAAIWFLPRVWRGPGLRADTLQMLRDADRFELLTLDPSYENRRQPGDWHDFKVLGRATVADVGMREALVESLNQAVKEGGSRYACFNPRHAIHATWKGKDVDVIICFECEQFQLYEDGVCKWGLLSKSAHDKFVAAANQLNLSAATEPSH